MCCPLFCFIQLETKENGIDKHKGGLSGVNLGLWQIDETVEEFFDRYPWLIKYNVLLSERYKNEGRKEEFLAVRALLHEMLGDKVGEITHNEVGKPMLKGYHVSVSHTRGFAAMVVSKNREVGVDVEYICDRVKRIASKFMRKDEKAVDVDSLLVHWCAKETVYKLFRNRTCNTRRCVLNLSTSWQTGRARWKT